MLCQFTVKNYKSIRDEMTFDMQAAAISEHEDKVIMDKNGEQFLPVSAIYGPNGGGKSNVLEARLGQQAVRAAPVGAPQLPPRRPQVSHKKTALPYVGGLFFALSAAGAVRPHSSSLYRAGASALPTCSATDSTSTFTVRSPKRSSSTSPAFTS